MTAAGTDTDVTARHGCASLEDLPNEVLVQVFRHVDRAETFAALARASRRMAEVARVPWDVCGRLLVEQVRRGAGGDWEDWWVVQQAIKTGRVAAVRWMLRDMSLRQAALCMAVALNKPVLCRLILGMEGVDPNGAVEGRSPLAIAACRGSFEALRALLDQPGIRVNAQDDDQGCTALHEAAEGGCIETFRLLLEEGGADPLVGIGKVCKMEVCVRQGQGTEEHKEAMLALLLGKQRD